MDSNIVRAFENNEFGELHTVKDGDAILFCAKDVAEALGYANTNKAVSDHCKGVPIRYPLRTAGGLQQARFITEGDLYRLIASSKLESAERFESWIFDDVLPAIRRTGGYMVAVADETPEQTMARAILIADDTIKRQRSEIDEMRPKAFFADAVASSDTLILVRDLAHVLAQNGLEIGQNRLFSLLRKDGYLEQHRNEATQKSIELGVIRMVETVQTSADGLSFTRRTAKVTPKGQVYFVHRYCKEVA